MRSSQGWPPRAGVQGRHVRSKLTDVVLVVDDDEAFRECTLQLLRSAGFDAFGAIDGFDGWAAVKRHRPKVAIVDIILPNMSGYELCDKVRLNPELAEALVVAVAGTGAEAEGSGFDGWLQKPFGFEDLLKWVRHGIDR